MKTILVPVDFSSNSEKACRYAIALAKKLDAKIIIMHAFESTVLYSKIPLTTVQLDYSYLYNGAVKKLQAFSKKMSKDIGKIVVELSVQQGLPSARIAELAMEKKADLIVIGMTGRGKLERMMFGSNALRSIKNAPCMVLAVPPKAVFHPFRKIAYATDLTKDNLEHVNKLTPIAQLFKSELIFLNVTSDVDFDKKQLKDIEKKINKIIHYRNKSGYVTTDFDIVRGVNFSAKSHKVDCIAVYTRHQNFFSKIFGSSLAVDLSLHSDMPLLVLHEDDISSFTLAPEKRKSVR